MHVPTPDISRRGRSAIPALLLLLTAQQPRTFFAWVSPLSSACFMGELLWHMPWTHSG